MEVNNTKSTVSIKNEISESVNLSGIIFQERRFNRFEFLNYVNSEIDGKYKAVKVKILNDLELDISKRLNEHIKDCHHSKECDIERVYEKALRTLDLKKEETLSKKSFWENILSNPIGLGILIIGVANFIIAIMNIINSF